MNDLGFSPRIQVDAEVNLMNEPIAEHDIVVLTKDVSADKLHAGDVGVVLAVHRGTDTVPAGYTLEIATLTGETAAVVDVPADHVRPVGNTDIRHARPRAGVA
jgi:hypothetical protein